MKCRCGFSSTSYRAMREHRKSAHSNNTIKSFLLPKEDGFGGAMIHIHCASDGTELSDEETRTVLKQAEQSVRYSDMVNNGKEEKEIVCEE